MSQNHPHDNIYSILGKLDALTPKETLKESTAPSIKEYARVPAQGSILSGVEAVQARLAEQFASEEKWIQKAVDPKKKGGLHKALHVPQGEKIPKDKIEKASHSKNAHLRHMAQFAKNVAHEDMNEDTCNECGMWESKCSCAKEDPMEVYQEGETTHKDGVTRHTKTDYPGYPTDDHDESDAEERKDGKKGRPRKAQTKKPRVDPSAEKKGRGRPKAEKPVGHNAPKMHDPFGRVKTGVEKKAKGKKVSGKAMSGSKDLDEKTINPYAIGMAASKKKFGFGSKPAHDLPKKVITKGHEIAKKIGIRESILESVNFKRMMDEQHMTLEEMLSCMQEDMLHFKKTGMCSDRLRDMLEVYSHAKKQMADEGAFKNINTGMQQPVHHVGKGELNQVPGVGPTHAELNPPLTPTTALGKVGHAAKQAWNWITDPKGPVEETSLEEELNELARLAGLSMADEGNAFTGKLKNTAKGDSFELDGKKYTDTSNLDEGTCPTCNCKPCKCNEGNAFGKAVRDAKADGIQPGEKITVGGKDYAVKEAQDLIQMMKIAGLDYSKLQEALAKDEKSYGDTEVDKPEEEPANRPKEEYQSMKASTMGPGEGDFGQKRMYPPHPAGDNGMTEPARKMPIKDGIKESTVELEARLAAEYESIKKVN